MNGIEKIRILIVEDHFLARMALATVINTQDDMSVIAEAESGDQAVAKFGEFRPHITLMDLRIPGMSGLEALQAIRKDFPKARIIVLTNYEGSEDIYRCLQAGAASYLLKDTSGDVLLEAIRAVHNGRHYLPRNVGEKLSERMPFSDLTPRETDVLKLIAKGKSNKEIGSNLDIAEKTVRIHVSNVLAKLGVGDRTQAAIAALQRGIVHLD
ncbi:MAG: response regulator transcription factor [Blastocatellia bacterium]|nr:response regulator transcription factor [Blastocatellia bacterium]